MKISNIKIQRIEDESSRVKAIVTITFDNFIIIRNVRIIAGQDHLFVVMPSERLSTGEIRDLCNPSAQEFGEYLKSNVLELYNSSETEKTFENESSKPNVEFKFRLIENDSHLLAICNAYIDNSFVMHKIKIIRDKDEKIVVDFPHVIDKNNEVHYIFELISNKDEFYNQIIDAYLKFSNTSNAKPKFATSEVKTPEERREKSNQKIKSQGIVCFEDLSLRERSEDVVVKDIDVICKKAIATLSAIQVACDINNGKYEESVEYFSKMLDAFNVKDCLNSKEKRLFDGTYSRQDVIDIDWEYETYWAIIWALGLIDDDISDASNICDCRKAISVVSSSKNYEEFKSKCKMRTTEEILDMLDLYFRYNWATTEKRLKPNTPTGNLNSSVVLERRRGLEWLISEKEDWYDISLNT